MNTATSPHGPQPVREDRPTGVALELLVVLARAPEPLTIADLQAELGGHPNRFRAPLEQLVTLELASETTAAPAGRGRPARGYTATPAGAQVALEEPARPVHVALVEAVAASLRNGDAPETAARELGRAWGERLPSTGLVPALAAQGFSPLEDGDDVLLRTCPMLDAARSDPTVVCSIHQGMLDALGEGRLTLVPFATADGCIVHREASGSSDQALGQREISHESPSRHAGR
jgi:predicted ArsR family transcriptional regulator